MEVLPLSLGDTVHSPLRMRVKVQSSDGATQWLSYAALTAAQASQKAQREGFRVLEVAVSQADSVSSKPASFTNRFNTQSISESNQNANFGRRFDLLLFSQELLSLLQAGLNLTEALDTLYAKARPGMDAEVLFKVLQQLKQGKNFSDVLESLPTIFPEVYVATARSSERTGNLPEALGRFIAYQQQFDALRKKLVAAAIYPAMLMVVGAFVVLFLLGFVVPRFAAVYESSGRTMPALSQALLVVGKFIHDHTLAVTVLLSGTMLGLVLLLRQKKVRQAMVDLVLSFPVLAQQVRLFRLGRFCRALSLLLASGISLPRALGMVGGLLGASQQAGLANAQSQIEQGQSFSQALVSNGLASAVAESLLKVGERSGQLAQMLERTAQFHDEELSRWIDFASRLLEPILMLLIGLVIGTVVVLMYLPIFDLAGSL